MSQKPKERERRSFWAYDSDSMTVQKVVGYTCAPENPEYWWVPQLGYSMAFGHHLFNTEKQAVDVGIIELEKEIQETIKRQADLKKRQIEIHNETLDSHHLKTKKR